MTARPGIASHHALPRDANAIARVHVDTWRATYSGIIADRTLDGMSYAASARRHLSMLGNGRCASFVAVTPDGEVAGFAMGGPTRGGNADDNGELYGLYVRQADQRRGVGKRLVAAIARSLAERGFARTTVWVLAANPARAFYDQLGGARLAEKEVEIQGEPVLAVAYGWNTIDLYRASAGDAAPIGSIAP